MLGAVVGGVFQTILSESFIRRCLHIIQFKNFLTLFLTCHLTQTLFKEFYQLIEKVSVLKAKY